MTRVLQKSIVLTLLSLMIASVAGLSQASEKNIDVRIPFRKLKIKPDVLSYKPPELKAQKSKSTSKKMSSRLIRMISQKTALKATPGKLSLNDMGHKVLDKQDVRVIFRTIDDYEVDLNEIRSRGGVILKERNNLVAVEIPVDKVEDIVTNVGGIEHARLPHKLIPFGVTSEGVNLTGANEFHSAGFTGSGIKVAVIDIGFKGLSEAQSNGDIPYSVITHDYTGKGLQTQYKHGTATAEIVYDVAPDAELHLLKVSDEVDIYDALDYCLDNDINIISSSIGTFGSGPGDGTGPICEAADEARANGILVVSSAGNSANSSMDGMPFGTHWKGTFYDSDFDDIHEFIQGDPESLYNTVAAVPYQDDDGNPETDDVTIVMRWNDWPNANIDYDLYLHDYDTGELVAYSNAIQSGSQPPLEAIVIDLPDSEDYAHHYALVVLKESGEPSGIEFELFLGGMSFFVPFYPYSLPIATSSSSITEPADAESVIAVGAINYSNWETGPQEDFSSQGPTNAWAGSGPRIKPDISGPDGVSGHTYGVSSFIGTSAATPHVAGAAALILSMHPHLSPDELQSVIESMAVDMGSGGKDNLYGWGRLSIGVYNKAPVLDPIGDKTTKEEETLSITLTGTDPDKDNLTYSTNNLPIGSNFNSETRVFTWTPGGGEAGEYTVHFEVSDGMDTDSEDVTITVTANAPPTISDITDQNTDEDQATGLISFTIGDEETAPDNLVVTATSSNTVLVPHDNIDIGGSGANRTIKITPAADEYGSATITVTVTDGVNAPTSDTFFINIDPINDPPIANAGSPQSVAEWESVTLDGSGSVDIDDGIASYLWVQEDGPVVDLSDPTSAEPIFTAPPVDPAGALLIFRLTVRDYGDLHSSDTVVVDVSNQELVGDLDDNGRVDLLDAVMSLQVAGGMVPMETIILERDPNGEDRIGVEDAIYILQVISGLRAPKAFYD